MANLQGKDGKSERRNKSPEGGQPEVERFDLSKGLTAYRKEDLGSYTKLRNKIGRRVLRQQGVTAIDVGYVVRQSKREFENTLAIRIHVQTKIHQTILNSQGLLDFSKDGHLQQLLGEKIKMRPISDPIEPGKERPHVVLEGGREIPIDVVEANYFPSQIQVRLPRPGVEISKRDLRETARSRVEPLVGGISVGNSSGQAGTLGAVVWDRTDGTACLLSNWHVLAGSASAGVGEPCFQPAIFDGGKPSDQVATLKRWIFDRHGDAALAEITCNRHFCSGETLGLWHPINGSIEPWLGLKVRKWSRTTGFTEGFIDGIDLATNLDYGHGSIVYLEEQYHVAPRFRDEEFSDRGDSGALLFARFSPGEEFENGLSTLVPGVDDQMNVVLEQAGDAKERKVPRVYYAVGLLFAGDIPGSEFGEFALASSIKKLEKILQFSFQPVFVPRSGIIPQQRDLLSQLIQEQSPQPNALVSQVVAPGAAGQDTRSGGPQPTPEPINGGGLVSSASRKRS